MVAIFFLLTSFSLFATTATWNGMTDGDWTESTNWTPTMIPDGSGDTANLTNSAPTTTTIQLTGDITLGTLNIDLDTGYTINPSTGSLEFLTDSSSSALNVTTTNGDGAHTITSTVTISTDLLVTQNSTGNLTISGLISGDSLTKAGSGTLVLSNASNSYSKATINAGAISISADGNLGESGKTLVIDAGALLYNANITHTRPISLTGAGSLQAAAGVSATVGGIISGSGSLTTSGATGTITLSGANTYTGGTTISSGTLSISSNTNLGNSNGALNFANGTLSVSATITIPRSGTISGSSTISSANGVTFSGNFDGNGSLTFTGGGSFVLSGNNSFSGGSTIANATTLIVTTDSLQGDVTFATASSLLTFNQDFDGSLAGSMTSSVASAGHISKLGSGNVTLSGNSAGYSGIITITNGGLYIDGVLDSATTTVQAAGTLGGSGTIGPFTSSGTVAPGSLNGEGTLNVSGAFTLNAGSTLRNSISPNVTDALTSTGAATITGSNLVVDPIPGFYGFTRNYTILSSSALTTGFASVTSTNSNFVPTVTYTATSVNLNVVILKPFALFPFSNRNTKAVGDNIDDLYTSGFLSQSFVNLFNEMIGHGFNTINDALDQMQPATYSSYTEYQMQSSAKILSLFHRSPSIFCNCRGGKRFWVEPFFNNLHYKKRDIQRGFQGDSGGIAAGFDASLTPDGSLGLGGVWNLSSVDIQSDRGKGKGNGFYGLLYTDWIIDSFYLGAALLSGVDFFDTKRNLRFFSIDRKADANFSMTEAAFQIKTAYLFGSPAAFFYPYCNVDWLYLLTPSISEKSAGFLNLDIRERSDIDVRTEVGIGLKVQDTNRSGDLCFSPQASLGYVNISPVKRPLYKASFQNTPIPFFVRGWDRTWNLLNAGFGLKISADCFSLNMEYDVTLSCDAATSFYNQHGSLLFSWSW